ncbi:MAG: glycosyltransferase family 4 protein [Chloroflexota bacterium]|nr:MAG: glycosyltransferase family 4 protein [Chloroflexota bacterium]
MKIAFAHDYLYEYGGAERVLEVLHEVWPEAPVYTSIFDPDAISAPIREMDVHTTFLQRLPRATRLAKHYFFLYPLAFEQLDLRQYDVVLSISSYMSKAVLTTERARHICYCLTPPRFLWGYETYLHRSSFNPLARIALPFLTSGVRLWDKIAADRVDQFVSISRTVQARVAKAYRRPSEVIYPPVDTAAFRQSSHSPGQYFLVVSRLGGYKRVDLAVTAFTELGLPLKIVGTGGELARLRGMAGPTVEFLERVPDAELTRLYQGCRALIFPGEEDFGLVLLEAQAAGRPVIAYAAGGALETVIPGQTGELFASQTAEALIEQLRHFDDASYSPAACETNAARFDKEVFKQRMREIVHLAHNGRY